MKVVIEVTATGVNVYVNESADVQVFDSRELESTDELIENEKGLNHATVGLFQAY